MKKLSKEKQQQLLLVGLATVGVIVGLWFGLIGLQMRKIHAISGKMSDTQAKIEKIQGVVKDSREVDAALQTTSARLNEIENGMPSGDFMTWFRRTIQNFNVSSYNVDIPSFGPPVIGDVKMLPNFPYHETSMTINGTAFYDQFGRFLSEFENRFPYLRVDKLALEPAPGTLPDDNEKLKFSMEIVALIKTNSL